MNKIRIILFLLLLISFWTFWLGENKVANDYHTAEKEVQTTNTFPYIWRETAVADGLGEYTGISLWSQPLHTFAGLLAFISISFWLQTKILVLLSLILGGVSVFKLLGYLKISIGKNVGIFFYLSNTFFLLLIDGGQISLALAYSVLPLAIYFFFKTFDQPNLKNRINLALSILTISVFDIRFVYILIIIFFLYLLTKFRGFFDKKVLRNTLISASLTVVILIGFHSFWILSTIIKPPQLPQTYERVSQLEFLSFANIAHSIFFLQPHWYQNIFGHVAPVGWEFVLIPILVFLAPLFRKKDSTVAFWLIVTFLGIFLSKGSLEPFGSIYVWLFNNIPGFSLFRDPVKFFVLTALSFTILISITAQAIYEFKTKKVVLQKFTKLSPYLIIVYLFFLMNPVWMGKMTGLFSVPSFEKEYLLLKEKLSQDKEFSRVFWIPTVAPLGYVSNAHPGVEAGRLAKKRPFAIGTVGEYETFNFLREAPFVGEIFDVAGIGYITYPNIDRKREGIDIDKDKYYYTFLNQLSNLPWLSKIDYSGIPLLKVRSYQDKFFVTENTWWVIGNDDIYNESTKSAQLKLSRNSLIFAEEKTGLGRRLDEIPDAKIILNKKSLTDLAASFIEPSKLIFPARLLDFEPDKTGWWKREAVDLIRWRDFLQTKYGIDNQDFDLGGGWAIGEGNRQLTIDNGQLKSGNVLLARVLESTRSGELNFSQNGQKIGSINTKIEGNNIRWFEVGKLQKDKGELEIISSGDINIVNALAVLTKDEWDNYQNKARGLADRIVSFNKNSATEGTRPIITYQEINPTQYKITVSNLGKPTFIVFSENYDNLWKLNGQTPLPVYSFLNGFRIEKDGHYTVEYEAQKYVNAGLVVSFLTPIALLLCVFKAKKI